MKCKGLITGVEEVKFKSKKDGSDQSFWKVNFVDTENSAGTPLDMSLSKEPGELAKQLQAFEPARFKVMAFNVFHSGAYSNFGGFVAA